MFKRHWAVAERSNVGKESGTSRVGSVILVFLRFLKYQIIIRTFFPPFYLKTTQHEIVPIVRTLFDLTSFHVFILSLQQTPKLNHQHENLHLLFSILSFVQLQIKKNHVIESTKSLGGQRSSKHTVVLFVSLKL